jgi:hypothetical protein
MKNDPDEIKNLAIGKNHIALLRKLRKKTIRELQQTDCAFAQKMPPVQNP